MKTRAGLLAFTIKNRLYQGFAGRKWQVYRHFALPANYVHPRTMFYKATLSVLRKSSKIEL